MRYAAPFLLALSLAGCSTLALESTFTGGTFHSPQPELTFKADGYEYLGKQRYSREARDPTAGRAGEVYFVIGEKHYLVKADRSKVSSMITVDIQSYPSEKRGFPPDPDLGVFTLWNYLWRTPERSLDSRKEVLFSGNPARFLVRAQIPESDPGLRYPLAKGYALPGCALVASWIMTGGAGNQYDARIDYLEALPEDSRQCDTWQSSEKLTDRQWRQVGDFEGRLAKLLPFVDSGAPPAGKASMESKLAELKKMFEGGLITREEYDAKRKELLEGY